MYKWSKASTGLNRFSVYKGWVVLVLFKFSSSEVFSRWNVKQVDFAFILWVCILMFNRIMSILPLILPWLWDNLVGFVLIEIGDLGVFEGFSLYVGLGLVAFLSVLLNLAEGFAAGYWDAHGFYFLNDAIVIL